MSTTALAFSSADTADRITASLEALLNGGRQDARPVKWYAAPVGGGSPQGFATRAEALACARAQNRRVAAMIECGALGGPAALSRYWTVWAKGAPRGTRRVREARA